MTLLDVKQLDNDDPLAQCQALFHKPAHTIYLDGNSLGLLPKAALKRVQEVTQEQWGNSLISSWNKHGWIDLPRQLGNRIGRLIGAEAGQVMCCDSISVNLFKVLGAALGMNKSRSNVVSTADNFPTDLYMVQGLTSLLGEHACNLQLVAEESLLDSIDKTTAVVMVTEVNFRTGRIVNIEQLCKRAHEMGALIVVDLAHSAGVLPVQLDEWQVDFAVGCTYKYLNSGPGAPAFVYAAKRHHQRMNQPLYGWMGHKNGFAFTNSYQADTDAAQMLVGTPPIIAMAAVEAALDAYNHVDIAVVRQKSMRLTELFRQLVEQSSACTELVNISPPDATQRGSQLSFEFEHAYALCQALISKGVIADFRAPRYIRFGFAPLYNSFAEVAEAVATMSQILQSKEYLEPAYQVRNKVT